MHIAMRQRWLDMISATLPREAPGRQRLLTDATSFGTVPPNDPVVHRDDYDDDVCRPARDGVARRRPATAGDETTAALATGGGRLHVPTAHLARRIREGDPR